MLDVSGVTCGYEDIYDTLSYNMSLTMPALTGRYNTEHAIRAVNMVVRKLCNVQIK